MTPSDRAATVWRSCAGGRIRAVIVALLVIACAAAAFAQPETGRIAGVVTDAASGAPLEGATIVLTGPAGSESPQQLRTTKADGRFAFEAIRAGSYQIEVMRVGYAASSTAELAVVAGRETRADHKLSEHVANSESQSSTDPIEEIKVRGDPTADLLGSIETRAQSDEIVNVLGAEDLSKFAAVDMADALKRVSGVNVVEGQFAIIRGLEDRYSSTLYNGAPVPSPDPDRQSPQLDLFPSEIVNQVVVSKTFGPELPSNSSGGSIDVRTPEIPENPLHIAVSAKGGINENAYDRFIEFENGNPVGDEQTGLGVFESEFGGAVKGRTSVLEREVRYKAIANWGTDYGTEVGFQEGRQPAKGSSHFPARDLAFGDLSLSDGRFDLTTSEFSDQLALYGGIGFDIDEYSDHTMDASIFYTRKSSETVQLRENGFLTGFDYGVIREKWLNGEDIDASSFDGSTGPFTPGKTGSFDAWMGNGVAVNPREQSTRGFPWYAAFSDSRSFDIGRDLTVYQLNGDHILDLLVDGLHLEWTGNYAATTQEDTSLGARFSYEPCRSQSNDDAVFSCPPGVAPIDANLDRMPASQPVSVQALGPGKYLARRGLFLSDNDIDEEQYFGRFDGDYEIEPRSWLTAKAQTGIWYEHAKRDVASSFLSGDRLSIECPNPAAQGCVGTGTQYVIFGDTAQQMGNRIFTTALPKGSDGVFDGLLSSGNQSEREISAVHVGGKTTFWEDLDVLGGVRLENIFIETKNDAFQPGQFAGLDQTPAIFPSKYLFFDRIDNTERELPTPRTPPFNDQILNIDVPIGPCRDDAGNPIPPGQPGSGQCVDLIDQQEIASLLNGEIDEDYALPSAALAYRPFRWMTLRGAYSQTVARPSFRELGYYVSADPGTDDLTVGNPQLGLSEVESWDTRVEFVWGTWADLFAVSLFRKDIEDPIEQIVLRDPSVFEDTSTDTFRTFFNNPSKGKIRGIELESRLNLSLFRLDFLDIEVPGRPYLDFLEYFSIGGNYSYFDAEVRRTQAELARSREFFFPGGNPTGPTPFRGLERKRRLYGQPEWIANADISFDHPDWGTKITLAYFAISDLLDAAGVASPDQSGSIRTFTLDRYIDSYEQLDLVISQELWKGFAVKVSAKNLTDSKRAVIYDPEQTAHRVPEREYRRGRDYSLTLSWTF